MDLYFFTSNNLFPNLHYLLRKLIYTQPGPSYREIPVYCLTEKEAQLPILTLPLNVSTCMCLTGAVI